MIARILIHMDMAHNLRRQNAQISRAEEYDMNDTLQHLFRYKAWANDELLTALAELGLESPITHWPSKP